MILLIVSILVLMAALVLLLWARKKLAAGRADANALIHDALDCAEKKCRDAQAMYEAAEHERELAGALLAHVRKIEDSLTHPRFALNLITGRIRALRHNEEPNLAEEVNAGDPDPDCKKCFGRGWDGRRRETGRVVPCVCIKRPA